MIFKRVRCPSCKKETVSSRQPAKAPSCERCGATTTVSKKWYCLITDNAGVRRKKSLSSIKSVALEQFGGLINDKRKNLLFDSGETIEALAAGFLKRCDQRERTGGIATSTNKYYKSRINCHIVPNWGKMKASAFLPRAVEIIDEYVDTRIDEVRPATVNREVAVLTAMLTWAKRSKKIGFNPLHGYEKLHEDNTRERVLSDAEMKKLRETYSGKVRWFIEVGLNTGLRIDGALSLRWSEFNLEAGVITKLVKGSKTVKIPITKKLREELKIFLDSQPTRRHSEFICPSPTNNKKPIAITTDWGLHRTLKKAGIEDFTFHDLRRTFATRFLLGTGDLHALATILGHSDKFVTERYSWVIEGYTEKKMAQFESSEYF